MYALQISNHDTVQEIRQVVLDRPESCFRTCFSLNLNGNRLDDFVELHTIEDIQEDSMVKVVDGMLTIAILHFTLNESCVVLDDNLFVLFLQVA